MNCVPPHQDGKYVYEIYAVKLFSPAQFMSRLGTRNSSHVRLRWRNGSERASAPLSETRIQQIVKAEIYCSCLMLQTLFRLESFLLFFLFRLQTRFAMTARMIKLMNWMREFNRKLSSSWEIGNSSLVLFLHQTKLATVWLDEEWRSHFSPGQGGNLSSLYLLVRFYPTDTVRMLKRIITL